MSISSQRAIVTARIDPQHVQRLRQIADENASTVSRTVARIIAERLDAERVGSSRKVIDDGE